MAEVVGVLAFAATLAGIIGALSWLGVRVRRRGIGGRLMGPVEELFHPLANRFRLEIETRQELYVPTRSPDDPWRRARREPRRRGRADDTGAHDSGPT